MPRARSTSSAVGRLLHLGLIPVLTAACGSNSGDRGSLAARSLSDIRPERCEVTRLASSPTDAEFSRIAALDLDSRGHIYVADQGRASVVVLGPDGRLLRSIGRRGEGPGEFDYIRNVQVLPGDSLLVFDGGLYRTSIFGPGMDRPSRTINHAEDASLTPPNWVEKIPGRPALFAVHREAFSPDEPPSRDYTRKQAVRVLDSRGGLVRDSVLVLPAPNDVLIARRQGSVAAAPFSFGRPSLLRLGPDGRIYYGQGDSLAIRVFSPEGKEVAKFALDHAAPEVTSSDLHAELEQFAGNQMIQDAMREQAPDRWPVFNRFVVDDRSRIWVGLATPSGEPTNWLVFDGRGEVVCSAPLPKNIELKRIQDGRAYGVEVDDLDVPRVVVYQVSTRS